MQGLIAVESHGQVCMSGPLGDFAGVSVDATGQVYSQNKSAAFVQTVHQPAGGKAGGPPDVKIGTTIFSKKEKK